MYQNCCKKCGSISLHTEVKGNNTGLIVMIAVHGSNGSEKMS